MAQFQVPQFIETEAKIVGPLTLKQFIYIAIAGLLSFFLFFTLRLEIWLVITIFIGTFAAALAFLKYNGRPFEVFVMNAALYIWKPKLYLWQRPDVKAQMPVMPKVPQMPGSTGSKMKNLWLSLVTQKPFIASPIGSAGSLQAGSPQAESAKTATPIPIGGNKPAQTTPVVHALRKDEKSSSGIQTLRNIIEKKKEK